MDQLCRVDRKHAPAGLGDAMNVIPERAAAVSSGIYAFVAHDGRVTGVQAAGQRRFVS